jgi:MFS family permease
MYTSGLLKLVCVVAAVLVAALVVTLLGVRERPGDVAPAEPVLADWPYRTSFWWLIVSRAFVSAGLYLILPFLGFYLRFAMQVQKYQAASLTLLLVMVGCSLLGTIPAGMLGDRFSKKSIIYIALILTAAGALSLTFLRTLAPLGGLAVLLGIGWGAYYAVDWALACNLLPQGRAGALMAIWNLGASAPQVAAPIIGGLLVDHVGAATGDLGAGYRVLFALIAFFVACGAGALAFVREPRAGLALRTS